MLKPTLAIALPAIVLGLGLARSTPQDRSLALDAVRQSLGIETVAHPPTVSPSSGRDAVTGPIPSDRVGWSTAVEPNRQGQFETTMQIAGRSLPVLVDTGATYVALSYEDAATIGLHPSRADYRYTMQTANGTAKAAGTVIPHIRVGNIDAYNVQAVVSEPGAMARQSLLGMSFLRKLSGFTIEAGRLVLRQ